MERCSSCHTNVAAVGWHGAWRISLVLCVVLALCLWPCRGVCAAAPRDHAGPALATDPYPPGEPGKPVVDQTLVADIEVAVHSYQDLERLRGFGLTCVGLGKCRQQVPQSLLPDLRAAGVDVVARELALLATMRSGETGSATASKVSLEGYKYGAVIADVPIPDCPVGWMCGVDGTMSITFTDAPVTAVVTRVVYTLRIQHTHVGELMVGLSTGPRYQLLWNQLGGATDAGLDDDAPQDADIEFSQREAAPWAFNGSSVNQTWSLYADDCEPGNTGFLDYFLLWVYYEDCALLGVPTDPWPADGASGASVETDLNWSDSPNATYYNVYFGTSPDSLPFIGGSSVSHYDPPALEMGTQYYWKIVAGSARCQRPGPVWGFTTVQAAGPTPTVTLTPVPGVLRRLWLPIMLMTP